MRNLFLILPLLVVSSLSGAEPSLRIDLTAYQPIERIDPVEAEAPLRLEHPAWAPAGQSERWLWVTSPKLTDENWREFSFTFTPRQNGRLRLGLMWANNGATKPHYGAYRKLSAEGVKLQNGGFKAGAKGWTLFSRQQYVAGEMPFVVASHDWPVTQDLDVTANVAITIRGEYRLAQATDLAEKGSIQTVQVESNGFTLVFDSVSGDWITLQYEGQSIASNPGKSPTIDVRIDGNTSLRQDPSFELASHEFDAKTGKLVFHYSVDGWKLDEIVNFRAEGRAGRLSRSAVLTNTTPEAKRFYNLTFNYYLPKRGQYLFPATYFEDTTDKRDISVHPETASPVQPLRRGELAALPMNREQRGYFRVWPVLVEQSPSRTLLLVNDNRRDIGHVGLTGRRDDIWVRALIEAMGYAEPGIPQYIEASYLEVYSGDAESALKHAVGRWYEEVGLGVPKDRPLSLMDSQICQIHPSGSFRYSGGGKDLGGFAGSEKTLLPRIAEMGFNTVWMNPVEDGQPYNPRDYFKPHAELGNKEQLQSMIRKAHQLGIKVWMDIVPHGNNPDDGIARGNSPLSMVITPDGNVINSYAFDYSDPDWQQYMSRVAAYYGNEYGADGLRIDYAIGSLLPNWRRKGFPAADKIPWVVSFMDSRGKKYRPIDQAWWDGAIAKAGGEVPPLPYERASLGIREGGALMIRRLRNAIRKDHPERTVLAEGGGPTLIHEADVVHDRQFAHLVYKWRRYNPDEFVRLLSRWLEDQKLAEPPNSLLMRIVACHDNANVNDLMGAAAMRAYFALSYFVRGVPMAVEYPFDLGYGKYLRELNRVRQLLPELRSGTADYLAIKPSAPEVFAVLRRLPGQTAVGLVNCSPRAVSFDFPSPASGIATEVFSGKELRLAENGKIALQLAPWESAVVTWRDKKTNSIVEAALPVQPMPQSVPQLVESEKNYTIRTAGYQVEIDRVTGLIKSYTAGNIKTGPMDLISDAPQVSVPKITALQRGDEVIVQVSSPSGLELTYRAQKDKLLVGASLRKESKFEKIGLIFPILDAARYQVNLAEGLLDDVYSNEQAAALTSGEYIVSRRYSYYRLTNPDLLWVSETHPLNYSSSVIRVTSRQGGQLNLQLENPLEQAPAGAFLSRRFNGLAQLHAGFFLRLPGRSDLPEEFTIGLSGNSPEKLEAGCLVKMGSLSLQHESLDWMIRNSHYQIRLRRSGGTIRDLTVNGKVLLSNQDIASTRGFLDRRHELGIGLDGECAVRVWKQGDKLHVRFQGEINQKQIVDQVLTSPILDQVEYIFDETPTFLVQWSVNVQAPLKADKPNLAWTAQVGEGEGVTQARIAVVGQEGGLIPKVSREAGTVRVALLDGTGSNMVPGQWYQVAMAIGVKELDSTTKKLEMNAPRTEIDPDLSFERKDQFYSVLSGKDILFQWPIRQMGDWRYICHFGEYVTGSGQAVDGKIAIQLTRKDIIYRQPLGIQKLAPGAYQFSVKIKGENLKPDVRSKRLDLTWRLTYLDKGGREQQQQVDTGLESTFDWKTITLNVNIPNESYLPEAYLLLKNGGGVLLIDDIQFRRNE